MGNIKMANRLMCFYRFNPGLLYGVLQVLICVLFTSCSSGQRKNNNTSQNEKTYVVNLDKAKVEDELLYSSVFSKMKTVILENSQDALVGNIRKMEVHNGYIFILDLNFYSDDIFIFSDEGKFIRKISEKGHGRGKLENVRDFTVDPEKNEIYILDMLYYIHKFDVLSGEYISSRKLEFANNQNRVYNIHYAHNALYGDAFFPKNASDDDFLLRKLDPDSGEQVEVYLTAAEHNKGWHNENRYGKITFQHTGKRTLFIQCFFMDTAMEIRPDSVVPFLTIEGQNLITREDVKKIKAQEDFDMFAMDYDWYFVDFVEHNDFIYFKSCNYTKKEEFCKHFVYNLTTGDTKQYRTLKDDFVVIDQIYMRPFFGCVGGNGIYKHLNSENISYLISCIEKGLCPESLDKKEELLKLNEESNPVIFYYEFK